MVLLNVIGANYKYVFRAEDSNGREIQAFVFSKVELNSKEIGKEKKRILKQKNILKVSFERMEYTSIN